MKLFFLCAIFICSMSVCAQPVRKVYKEPYEVMPGLTVGPGDTVYLGMGTLPNGYFKYVFQKPNLLIASVDPLSKFYNGKYAVVKQIEYTETRKTGVTVYIVIDTPYVRHYVDVKPAIETGEVVAINGRKFGTKTNTLTISVADELLKLKQLLDAGAINQVEYEAQKKKLLN